MNVSKKILIVEDDRDMAGIWIALFSAMGYEVVWVTTVADAKRAYDEGGRWDLIILDGELAEGGYFYSVLHHICIVRKDVTTRILAASGRDDLRTLQIYFGCTIDSGGKSFVPRVALAELALAA
jgi:DNA-binding response OmpR family regulator